jgi:hypothetical protein
MIVNTFIGFCYLIFLFRSGIIWWVIFTVIGFINTKIFYKYRFFPLLVWAIHITILFMNTFYFSKKIDYKSIS